MPCFFLAARGPDLVCTWAAFPPGLAVLRHGAVSTGLAATSRWYLMAGTRPMLFFILGGFRSLASLEEAWSWSCGRTLPASSQRNEERGD